MASKWMVYMKLQQLRYIVEVVNHNLNVHQRRKDFTHHNPESVNKSECGRRAGHSNFFPKRQAPDAGTPAGQEIIRIAREVLSKVDA